MGDELRHRVVFLGAGKVGKTCIVHRFLDGNFPEKYRPTVEELHPREYNINGSILKVDLLDTAGNHEFPAMRRLSMSTAHGFVLVYAVNDTQSLEEVKQLWEQIKEVKDNFQEIPCVVVGNKSDLKAQRRVDADDVAEWMQQEGMPGAHVEVSARDGTSISVIFQRLLQMANIPEVRKLEPIITRRLSANASRMTDRKDKFKDVEPEKPLSRSRSLIRRATRPRVKHTGDPSKNDCTIS